MFFSYLAHAPWVILLIISFKGSKSVDFVIQLIYFVLCWYTYTRPEILIIYIVTPNKLTDDRQMISQRDRL
jgi:hypothetical protein